MTCSKCGHENIDGAKFCPECGASTTQRPAPAVTKPRSSEWVSGVVVGVGALVVIRLMSWVIHTSEAPISSQVDTSVAPRSQHVTAAMACAATLDDVVSVAEAYSHGDSDAILGLIGRRKAIPRAAGTAVSVLLADSPFRGIDALYVESGSYIGERCYGVAALLAPN
jgi:hypothetical protein